MGVIKNILHVVPLPRLVCVEQRFPDAHIENVPLELAALLRASAGMRSVKPGARIAITAGSRKISRMPEMLHCVAQAVRERGAEPFIVPAMGSHGGATAAGQRAVLEGLGIAEETVGAPVISSMETDLIGTALDGRPVYIDRAANRADGIIVMNRIKCHTSFRGKYESGLMKMMAIGLGKEKGASHYHQTGYEIMSEVVEAVGKEVLRHAEIIAGIGVIENAYGKTAEIACLEPEQIAAMEPALLERANSLLPRLPMERLDVLAIAEIGKDISGTGMDTNVVGRPYGAAIRGMEIATKRIVLSSLTALSHGNASGIGNADIITRRLYQAIDMDQVYTNCLTSTAVHAAKIPLVMPNDRLALQAAVKTSNLRDFREATLCCIRNTKRLERFYVSENLLDAMDMRRIVVLSEPFEPPFDSAGDLRLTYQEETTQ
ncbi:MAG: DUF362 domain-containing protein [Clostridiaceae bacterium]|nr:DUF362 domain-containing protein [Eubacteriales bacterium]